MADVQGGLQQNENVNILSLINHSSFCWSTFAFLHSSYKLGAIESDCEYPEDYNQTFLTLVNELFPEWSDPKNVDQALDMYGNLLAAISNFE